MLIPKATFVAFLSSFLLLPRDVFSSIRGSGREKLVITYGRTMDVEDVFDALEEAGARHHKQLTCTRGMVIDVDEDGRKMLESKAGIEITANPHDHNKDDKEDQGKEVPDFLQQRTLFQEEPTCTCEVDHDYVLTERQVKQLKTMIEYDLLDDVDYATNPCPTEQCSCPFTFRGRGKPGCNNPNVTTGWPDVPEVWGEVGANSFEGNLADSCGAIVRNVFHDAGTFDVRENPLLSGLNGCVDLTSDKNLGLENVTDWLFTIKYRAEHYQHIQVTMADLNVIASTVCLEITTGLFNYYEAHETFYENIIDPIENPVVVQPGEFLPFLDIPFKYGRQDIPYGPYYSCPCEITTLPGAEPLSKDVGFTRQDLIESMGLKFDFTLMEIMELMGVHSLGRLNEHFSGYQGRWNFANPAILSDDFYSQSTIGRRLEKQFFNRTIIDPKGKAKEVCITEWRRGGGNSDFPFIFLNSDIVFQYDLTTEDGNGNLCNATEDRRDGCEGFDVCCEPFTDDVAVDYERFGSGYDGYKEWLGRFSKIYRRMTNELVPCGELFDPAKSLAKGLEERSKSGNKDDDDLHDAYVPDGVYQAVRSNPYSSSRRTEEAENNDRELSPSIQLNNFGYFGLDCHEDMDSFCFIYGPLYPKLCQYDVPERGRRGLSKKGNDPDVFADIRKHWGEGFEHAQICHYDTDLPDGGYPTDHPGGFCRQSSYGRKLAENEDTDRELYYSDSEIIPGVVILGPPYTDEASHGQQELELYSLRGFCDLNTIVRRLKKEGDQQENVSDRKLGGCYYYNDFDIDHPIAFTTHKKGYVYTYCPFETYTKISTN